MIHSSTSRDILKQDHHVLLTTEIRVYSNKELCILYNVCNRTFNRWLVPFKDDIGTRYGRYFTIVQGEIIFLKIGIPYIISEKR